MSNRINKRLNNQLSRFYTTNNQGKHIEKYVGLNRFELEKHIDKLLLPEMNRLNYGITWQLDHIVPVHLFDLSKEEDIKLCYNYNNLFPLLEKHNTHKGGSIHFSIDLLKSLPINETIVKLLTLLYKEKEQYDQYLNINLLYK